jgi:CDK inhibitor PHO81
LKKWDKRARSTTKELYLSRQVDIQPCFNHKVLAELTDAVTTNLAEVDALLDRSSSVVDSSMSMKITVEPVTTVASSTHIGGRGFADDVLDAEAELLSCIAENEVEMLFSLLQKHAHSSLKDDPQLLSRIFLNVCNEASSDMLVALLNSNLIDRSYCDDISNRTCLHEAAIRGRLDVLMLCAGDAMLITDTSSAAGKNSDSSSNSSRVDTLDVYGRSAMHYAAMYGWGECVLFLLSANASVDILDTDDHTPLTYAISGGFTKCVEIFLEHDSSNVDAVSVSLVSPNPLTLSCEHGHREIATLLLAKGAKLVANADGVTPLHLTARQGNAELCQLLISHGADVNAVENFNGWTAVFFAASEGHIECVTVLLGAKCLINVPDEIGWLPWTYALYRGHMEVAAFLEVETLPQSISPTRTSIAPTLPVAIAGGILNENDDDASIQPMAPSALFGDKIDLEISNLDDIPSLCLPPPIIPFRI